MSQYPTCSYGQCNENYTCPQCKQDNRLSELEAMCRELKSALEEANNYDEVAEGYNSSNFSSRRQEFYELVARADQLILGKD